MLVGLKNQGESILAAPRTPTKQQVKLWLCDPELLNWIAGYWNCDLNGRTVVQAMLSRLSKAVCSNLRRNFTIRVKGNHWIAIGVDAKRWQLWIIAYDRSTPIRPVWKKSVWAFI